MRVNVLLLATMKKKYILTFPILALSALSSVSCNTDNRIRISYGSPINSSMVELTYNEFATRMNDGENMLVATYHSDYSLDCSCWNGFKLIADKYADDNDLIMYKIDRKLFEGHDDYGLTLLTNSNPTCFITEHGKVNNEYIYSNSGANAPLFESYDAFSKAMNKVIKMPQVMIVNRDYITNAIFEEKQDEFIVYQARSTCSDCNYCTPNALLPYSESHNMTNKIYMIDIDYLRADEVLYQEYKDEFGLSEDGNETFGYGKGVVPTFQYWKKGELADACVYFNDSVDKVDDKWTITDSYYTKERVANLKYTDEVLKDKILNELEIDKTYAQYNYYSWLKVSAAKYHNKILESFLDYYA